jgi:hypothetical protein
MPIRFRDVQGGEILIEQYANKPTVYLDNWAFNTFALKEELGKKFTKIMNDKNGSIAFSIMNLYEITVREDDEQIKSIVSFIDSIDGIFIDVSPDDVIKREEDYRKRDITQMSPCADVSLLKANFLYAHNPLRPFRISELILKHRDEIKTLNYEREQNFEKVLYPTILKARADSKVLERARKRFKQKIECTYPCTQQIYSKCIDFIASNQNMKMPNKEWCDVFNLVVPVAYCDFVLADSRWTHFIRTLKLKKPCIAKVYSCKQIEKFLEDLKNYENIT